MALRYKPRRRRCAAANRRERSKVTAPNQAWSLDFVADQLTDGRRFRALTVVDVFTRESLAIELGQGLGEKTWYRYCAEFVCSVPLRKPCFATTARSSPARQWICGHVRPGCRSTFPAGKANRKRVCGFVQRNVAIRVFGCALVHDSGRGEATDRDLAAEIQEKGTDQQREILLSFVRIWGCRSRPHKFMIVNFAERTYSNACFVVPYRVSDCAIAVTLSQYLAGCEKSLHRIVKIHVGRAIEIALEDAVQLAVKVTGRAVSIESSRLDERFNRCHGRMAASPAFHTLGIGFYQAIRAINGIITR